MSSVLRLLSAADQNFDQQLDQLLAWESVSDEAVQNSVKDIIDNIRQRGDEALIEYTQTFDQFTNASLATITVSKEQLNAALEAIPADQKQALEIAAQRVCDFHQHQIENDWQFEEANGNVLGQKITPLAKAGVYVPGGKAAYPSSVLMNIIPAKVAGVEQVIMVTPAMHGEVNNMVLAAAAIAGVDQVFLVGGAQAVAALAYGTQTIPKVDKITGPGNIYVATAKREVFGQVGIDMIAGPSEVLVVCDGKTDPDWIAMDLFSQAEHDEAAQAILISPDKDFLQAVSNSIEKLIKEMERKEIISISLADRGALIHVEDLEQAIALSNRIAPEHLELSIENAEAYIEKITHAGAIFVGRYTAEVLGDYCAGPNHVLPTSGTARFSSPLGVYDFVKRTSIINCSAQGASELGEVASVLARGEALTAHARSAEYRILFKDAIKETTKK